MFVANGPEKYKLYIVQKNKKENVQSRHWNLPEERTITADQASKVTSSTTW